MKNKRDISAVMAHEKTKTNPGFILAVIVFILILVYIVSSGYRAFSRDTVKEVEIVIGQVDKPETLTGVIVRDESIYISSSAGFVSYLVHDKEKVKKNGAIANIENHQGAAEDTVFSSASSTLEGKLSIDSNFFSKEILKMNKEIKELADEKAGSMMNKDITELYQMKDVFTLHMEQRNQVYISGDKEVTMQPVDVNSSRVVETIEAKAGGIVSYYVDGLEETLSVDARATLSKEYIDGLTLPFKATLSREREDGEPVCKVVKSDTWYIASFIPNGLIKDWEVGQFRRIFIFKEDKFVEEIFEIETMISHEEETMLVFKTDKYVHEYLEDRVVSMQLSEELKEGFQVPVKSIVEKTVVKVPASYLVLKGDLQTVVKSSPEGVRNVEVSISHAVEEDIYITMDLTDIKLHDAILDPEDHSKQFILEDIENVQGVYVTNTGVVTFRKINVTDAVTTKESSYIILSPEHNKKLKIHDKIVADVEKVVERQTIY